MAAWLKDIIFVVATVVVGGYGFATFVCGIIPVLGGAPMGSGSFIAIMVASATIGAVIQWMLSRKETPQTDGKAAPLMGNKK